MKTPPNPQQLLRIQCDRVLCILCAADGRIEGRARIQKMVYLLEEIIGSSSFFYSYDCGPYSEELSDTLNILEYVDKKITEEHKEFTTVFKLNKDHLSSEQQRDCDSMPFADMQKYVALMKNHSSVCLEIAATIHWIICQRKIAHWKEELLILKGNKARQENLEKSLDLLEQLGLPVANLLARARHSRMQTETES